MFRHNLCRTTAHHGARAGRLSALLMATTMAVALLGTTPAAADNAVKLKVLVVSTGNETTDVGLTYIKPVLEEMGMPYDILNSATTTLTAATLSPNGCSAATAGCSGNYNGILVTSADLAGQFTPAEWDLLHQYEKDFQVREAVLSGWPATYSDTNPPGIYLDYGLVYAAGGSFSDTRWAGSAGGTAVFEYINKANPLPITDFAFATTPRNDNTVLRDGTVASVEPLLTTADGKALVSIVRYTVPGQTTPARQVLISTISNAAFLVHSQVLAYEFINFATQGVFVGGRFVYMSAHLDDLFLPDELWNTATRKTDPNLTYRLKGSDITNGVSAQSAFRAAHPTAGSAFKLDFPFNGAGAVVDPAAATLTANLSEDLVAAVVANKAQFRFINHTFSHADMDKAPVPATAPCDYPTFTQVAPIQAEITKNRTVWQLLNLPERANNNQVLVSGNHSGLKDRKCTDIPELHPGMDVQSDDVPFWQGANPLFFQAMASVGVNYVASDSSQTNQGVEQYVTSDKVNDGSSTDRLLLPRYPANVFYNVINPTQLVDEYNYIFHDRYVNGGQDPCSIPGAICTTRDYAQVLAAESDTALRHMLSFKKWPHFFHQGNLANYGGGNTLQFDWLNAAFATYETLLKLPVQNLPYYSIGDETKNRLTARSATIQATWNRTTKQVMLSANKTVPNLVVTGVTGGTLYGGQRIRRINVNTTPQTVTVDQALTQ